MRFNSMASFQHARDDGRGDPRGTPRSSWAAAALLCLSPLYLYPAPGAAQTVTVVGTAHLGDLRTPPDAKQLAHTVEALSSFEPTQVCVESLNGLRIESLMGDVHVTGRLLQVFASSAVRTGAVQQMRFQRRASDARAEARELASREGALDPDTRTRLIGLQLAAYEFPSAVLNWSYLDQGQREKAIKRLGAATVEILDGALNSMNEIYALAVPLARGAGLRALCAVDALADEGRATLLMRREGTSILEKPAVQERIQELSAKMAAQWQPDAGPSALSSLLAFTNGSAYAELDRHGEWEVLIEYDNEAAAGRRRLMYWHARNAEIAAGLFRALARGPDERVLMIIGAAHRSFLEDLLRSQQWLTVEPALKLLTAN